MNNEEKIGVYLYCRTRIGDMNGFYDYTPKEINTDGIFLDKKVTHIGELIDSNEIICDKNQENLTKKGRYLFRVLIKPNNEKINYFIKVDYKFPFNGDKMNEIKWEEYIWYVINSDNDSEKDKNDEKKINEINTTENDDYVLGENDILKIGNYKYIVSKISIKEKVKVKEKVKDKNEEIIVEKIVEKDIKKKEKFWDFLPTLQSVCKCKFCGELMVRLCKCQEYIHVNELKKWMNDRYKKEEDKNISSDNYNYYFQIYRCDSILNEENNQNHTHCNTDYPLRFKYKIKDINESYKENSENKEIKENKEGLKPGEEIFNFVDIQIPEDKDYLIIESFPEKEKKSNKIMKSVHVVEIAGDKITIGRNHKNQIILEDKMVSSFHAVIKCDKNAGKLVIKNLSKHAGTLALVHPDDKFLELGNKPIFFQANKSFIEANVTSLEDCKENDKPIKNEEEFSKNLPPQKNK